MPMEQSSNYKTVMVVGQIQSINAYYE